MYIELTVNGYFVLFILFKLRTADTLYDENKLLKIDGVHFVR